MQLSILPAKRRDSSVNRGPAVAVTTCPDHHARTVGGDQERCSRRVLGVGRTFGKLGCAICAIAWPLWCSHNL